MTACAGSSGQDGPRIELKERSLDLSDDALQDELPAALPPRVKGTRAPEQTSAAILAAAVYEFTHKGYGGARIDEIAKRAGANKRLIYHYFGNKDALYLAVLESVYAGIRTAEAELNLTNRDPVEALGELTRFTWRYFLAHPEFLSLLATENVNKGAALGGSARIRALNSPLIAKIGSLLDQGVAEGKFRRGVDPLGIGRIQRCAGPRRERAPGRRPDRPRSGEIDRCIHRGAREAGLLVL